MSEETEKVIARAEKNRYSITRRGLARGGQYAAREALWDPK